MLNKPEKCCGHGTFECQIPMPINGRVRMIDLCVADIVSALNAANMSTVASCCGHDVNPARVDLDDGRCLVIFPDLESGEKAIQTYITNKE